MSNSVLERSEITDGLLLDLSETAIADLTLTGNDSALDRALRRVLAPNTPCDFNSFNSNI
jgi:hypothetical protein